jgi:predicted glycosyl hydrolase (DUF1957 family)
MIIAADEDAIGKLPEHAWKPGIAWDGGIEEDKAVAEITHLMSRAGNWPAACGGSSAGTSRPAARCPT